MVDPRERALPFGDFLFPRIFQSFRMAIQPTRLAFAFAAVALICLTGWLMDLNRTVVVLTGPTPAAGIAETTELDVYMVSRSELRNLLGSPPPDAGRTGVFATLRRSFAIQCRSGNLLGCLLALVWAFTYHTLYSVVFFAVVLVVLSAAGGAICRLTALQFAHGRRLSLGEAWRFSTKRITSLVGAPIGPLVIALLLGVPIVAFGALGNIPVVGELLTGLLLPLGLVVGPFIAVLLIGAVGGFSLLSPAIAYEDSDFFDAISRSFSNVYARPWRMIFYTLTAAAYGAICCLFVRFFAFLVLWVTRGFLQVGLRDEKLAAIWPAPSFGNLLGTGAAPDAWSLWLSALFIRIWVLVIIGLTISFFVSFYFSASTIIYALMRNRVDGTNLDEIYIAADGTAERSA